MQDDIEQIITAYRALHLEEVLHYDKFNQYAITHHSTAIEGSTLTIEETRLLLDEGLMPTGKPLAHSLMATDHYDALLFTIESAKKRELITLAFIQAVNNRVMQHTGSVYKTVFGSIDAGKRMYRKGNVSAGNTYFVNYDKVPVLTEKLCNKLREQLPAADTIQKQLDVSFTAHFDLVSIHPFYDGNGRTSRLLMNYIQQLFGLPLAIVFTEDKAAYYEALQQTRIKEDLAIFLTFMYGQYVKFLEQEISLYKKMTDNTGLKGFSFVF